MKVHPTLQNDVVVALTPPLLHHQHHKKKLLRLPHVFTKVLELPFNVDADVSIEETNGYFKFTVLDTGAGADVVADTVVVHPGVTKVVVRPRLGCYVSMGLEFEVDLWRYRLPDSTRPELAEVVWHGEEFVVIVPKCEERVWGRSRGTGGGSSFNNLILVN